MPGRIVLVRQGKPNRTQGEVPGVAFLGPELQFWSGFTARAGSNPALAANGRASRLTLSSTCRRSAPNSPRAPDRCRSGARSATGSRTPPARWPLPCPTSATHPLHPPLDVYKVAGKVFLIVTDDPDEQIITVKSEPERARAHVHAHTSITSGRYLDKRHWITLGPGPGITKRLITDAVEDSCDLVAEQLPRRDRPGPLVSTPSAPTGVQPTPASAPYARHRPRDPWNRPCRSSTRSPPGHSPTACAPPG